MSEYGADTIPGLHNNSPFMFTEEYQKDFYIAHHGVFDSGYFIDELPWTMFDFGTEQTIIRVGGLNRKGLFTRQRQPKAAAFLIKDRYQRLESIPTPPFIHIW
jgi:beta-glucuronidase